MAPRTRTHKNAPQATLACGALSLKEACRAYRGLERFLADSPFPGGDGSVGGSNPVTPGAGIETRQRKTGDGVGKNVMAGGHAGAAVGDQLVAGLGINIGQLGGKLRGRLEAPVGVQIVGTGPK